MTALALLAAGLAGWLWVASPVGLQRLALPVEAAEGRRQRRLPWPGALLAALAIGAVAGWAPGISAGCVAGVAHWVWRRHRLRRDADRERAEVVRSCQLLAGMLRLGLVPTAALPAAAQRAPLLAEAAAVQELGGRVGPVLRTGASVPGRAGLAELAQAWEVAERTGASMTATLDAVAGRLVAAAEVHDTVEAELSAPRATGRLLAALPIAGLALGYLLGGDPVGFLTGLWFGQACLVAGVVLGCAGLVWTELLADRHGG